MYIANTWVRTCVDRIVDRAATIKPIVRPVVSNEDTGKELSDATKRNLDRVAEFIQTPNDQYQTFTDIRKMVLRDSLKYDGAGMEIVRKITNGERYVEVFAVPGDAVVVNTDSHGNLDPTNAFIQVDIMTTKQIASWPPEQFLYFVMNKQSNRIYGLSPLESLIQTVTAELYSSQYNLDFFYNNATPRFAVLMEGLGPGQGAPALQRFRNWWDQELKGNPHRPIVIGTESGKIQFQKVGLSNEEMQFQQYSAWLLTKIMASYKMQPAVIGISSGETVSKVSTDEQFKQFKLDAINPLLTALYERINQQIIFSPKVLAMSDVYIDYDLDITDKKTQSEWHEAYLRNGVLTANECRHALGLRPVPWGNVPYLQNNVTPFGAGPNGVALPPVASAGTGTEAAAGGNAVARQFQINGRDDIRKAVTSPTEMPIGWENIPVEERITVIENLIKERQATMSKRFFIPETL
jgi:HK97 family phage portal protein